MRSLRGIACCLAVALLAAGAACTKDDPQVSTPIASGGPVTSNEAVAFVPGEYRYSFNGIVATLSMDGSTGALDIQNASGAELAAPVIYAITDDAARHDAKIDGAASIADGGSAALTVTFPDAVTAGSAGLIVLSFGSDNVGAFAPVPVSAA